MAHPDDGTIALTTHGAGAAVSLRGGELVSWNVDGMELLWSGEDPWPIHAPVLFPVICRVPADEVVVDGVPHPMVEHGFGRHRLFTLREASDTEVSLELRADEETRRAFPYDFALHVTHRLDQRGLTSTFRVRNESSGPGARPMPYALGHHPAYRWPLDGVSREGHLLVFDEEEPAVTRRLEDGLLATELRPPVAETRVVRLDDELFADSAVIMPDVRSRGLVYRSYGGRALRVTWQGFTGVTLWSPVTSDLVCVETWRGLPGEPGRADFEDRPDLAHLEPGAEHIHTYRVEVLPPG